ncbi:hypothetical protein AB2M62_11075 [Sphingomonas sp. MMS12-HWE2-04]|uniref:hypothetical protein n=1 Tax=Sphingomonas sp. MMS12-HWE2-04 TaxID=3234199 RepID=UPI00384AA297
MTRSNFLTPDPAGGAFRVRAPRASDAIGSALSNAYARDPALPDDMVAILRQLDRAGGGATY